MEREFLKKAEEKLATGKDGASEAMAYAIVAIAFTLKGIEARLEGLAKSRNADFARMYHDVMRIKEELGITTEGWAPPQEQKKQNGNEDKDDKDYEYDFDSDNMQGIIFP